MIKKYINALQFREKELFPETFKPSGLSESDIINIEQTIGYSLPDSYKEFLMTYQIPTATVFICFCGDSFANSFEDTYSREENKYIEAKEGEPVVREFNWKNYNVSSGESYLNDLKETYTGSEAWLKAGYIYLGEFCGYQLYYDLTNDKIYNLYFEDVYLSKDYDDPVEDRKCMENEGCLMFDSFILFLRFVCLSQPYDEDNRVFPQDNI